MPAKELTDEQLDAYSRQISLEDIGYEGQLKLRNASVAIVGVGGLGAPTALKLAAMGVGRLRLIDRDVVSRSDLHRQYLYDTEHVGYTKVEVAAEKLSKLNPDVEIEAFATSLGRQNAEELLRDIDLVIDGLDQMEARYLINRASQKLEKPYVFGAAIEYFGNATTILPGKTACLECFYQGFRDEDLPKCAVVGVHPSALGIISSVQVSEATRILTGQEPHLANKLLYVNLKHLSFDVIQLEPVETCPVSGSKPSGPPRAVSETYFEEGCSRDGKRVFVVTPRDRVEVDLNALSGVLKSRGATPRIRGDLGVTYDYAPKVTVSFLKSGIMIAQVEPGATKLDARDDVLKIYDEALVQGLGLPRSIVPRA